MAESPRPMSGKTVFISYSHDSEEHSGAVLALSERLRADGITTLLDQYLNGSPRQGWPRWMLDQLDAADSVLVVCTETYYRRFRGHEDPSKGKGADWEGALITQEIYDSRSQTLKFVPVFLSVAVEKWVPEPLRALNRYLLTSERNYQDLYNFLLGQAGVEAHPVGPLKPKPRRTGTPLTFGETAPSEVASRDISRIIKYAPAALIGREAETELLSDEGLLAEPREAPGPSDPPGSLAPPPPPARWRGWLLVASILMLIIAFVTRFYPTRELTAQIALDERSWFRVDPAFNPANLLPSHAGFDGSRCGRASYCLDIETIGTYPLAANGLFLSLSQAPHETDRVLRGSLVHLKAPAWIQTRLKPGVPLRATLYYFEATVTQFVSCGPEVFTPREDEENLWLISVTSCPSLQRH